MPVGDMGYIIMCIRHVMCGAISPCVVLYRNVWMMCGWCVDDVWMDQHRLYYKHIYIHIYICLYIYTYTCKYIYIITPYEPFWVNRRVLILSWPKTIWRNLGYGRWIHKMYICHMYASILRSDRAIIYIYIF